MKRARAKIAIAASQSQSQLGGALEKIAGVVKWIVFAVIAIVVVVFVVLAVLHYLAPFTGWAQRTARRDPELVGQSLGRSQG